MPALQIIADENIPLAAELFGSLGAVRLMPGREMTRENVRDADVLLVRSVTPVGKSLLEGTSVRFIGSATIGTDHIETEYLHQRKIAWASAPGANAGSVVEYVLAALLRLAVRRGEPLRGKTLGIVGCGNIGGRLIPRAEVLGMTVLKNDPPLERLAQAAGRAHDYLPLADVLERSDILTCHVPLRREGPDATAPLIGPEELAALGARAWLVNTSRGPVVDNRALLRALRRPDPRPGAVVLDVWENEPHPSADLVRRVDIGTPHIAGYSYEGKVTGAVMLLDALARHLGADIQPKTDVIDTCEIQSGAPDPGLPETDWLEHLVARMYDIAADDRRMRRHWPTTDAAAAALFTTLRRRYPKRRTFGAYGLRTAQVPEPYRRPAAEGVGVRLDPTL